jgi:RecJ-like exonuclease
MAKEPQKTFEQNMEAMSKMTPADMQAKIKELDKICVCGKCPTYIGTGEKKLTFCAIGKSTMIKKDKGCLCPTCPVQKNLALRWDRYCLKGSGKEQSGMK